MAANPQTETNALAIRPSGAVATALRTAGAQLGMNLLEMVATGRANLVSPAVMLDSVPAMYRLAVRVETIDPQTETYPAPGKPGQVCLGATALQKISRNAQVDWKSVRQIDDWRDPHRVKYEAIGELMNLDGTRTRMAPGVVVLDLRGEPSWPAEKLGSDTRAYLQQAEAAKDRKPAHFEIPPGTESSKCRDCNGVVFWIPNPYRAGKKRPVDANGLDHWKTCPTKQQEQSQEESGWPRVFQARHFIDRLAATMSMSAAIRKLGVPTSMPKERAAQPWVVMALVFDPPADDPEVRRMLVAHALGAQAALYGPPALPHGAQSPALDQVEQGAPFDEPIDVSGVVDGAETDGATIDVEPCQTTDLGPDPWDPPAAASAAKSCRLPVPQTILDQVPVQDGQRMEYLSRLNAIARNLFADLGAERAKAIISHHAPDFDGLTWPLPQIADLGRALKAELPGGAR